MEEKLTFRESQLKAYEILKFIDKICREQKLTYFLFFGSLIGAIRDNGIIPWDDDIDVIMPRPDYDKLVKYCSGHTNNMMPFQLFEHSLNPQYPHPIARMSDMRYKIEFDNEKDYNIGLFVDIYPLDGVGNDLKRAQKICRANYRNASLCFLTSRKKFGRDNTSSFLRMMVKFPAYIWANLLGNRHYNTKIEKKCRAYDYEKSRYVACLAQPWREQSKQNRNIMKKEWFALEETRFEKGIYYIPQGYDNILTMAYGDYMTPLPESQRKVHHTYDTFLRE